MEAEKQWEVHLLQCIRYNDTNLSFDQEDNTCRIVAIFYPKIWLKSQSLVFFTELPATEKYKAS